VPKIGFNKTEITKLVLPVQKKLQAGEQKYFWDKYNPGIGLKVTPSKIVYIVQARGKDGKDKREVFDNFYSDITIEEAIEKGRARKRELESEAGASPEPEGAITLRAAFEKYIQAKKATQKGPLRDKTVEVYRSALYRCFPDWLDKPAAQITSSLVVSRYQEIATTEGPRSKQGGAKAQASQACRTLRAVLNHTRIMLEDDATGLSPLPANPMKKLAAVDEKWNTPAKKENDLIPTAQLAKWYRAVSALPNPTMSHFLLFCLFTGLRRNAACNLRWCDIDFKAETLTIPAHIDKTGREQTLPMSDYVKHILERRPRILGNDFVFPGDKDGECIKEPKRAIEKVVRKTGIKFSCHTLRKTFATAAESLDISHLTVKHLLNHSVSDDVTAHHYITIKVDQLREPMQKIADFLKEHCGIQTGNALSLTEPKSIREALS
jgi:integrase